MTSCLSSLVKVVSLSFINRITDDRQKYQRKTSSKRSESKTLKTNIVFESTGQVGTHIFGQNVCLKAINKQTVILHERKEREEKKKRWKCKTTRRMRCV